MKKFKVYFELYGKKMVSTVEADTEAEARAEIRYRIKFHKVEEVKEIPDFLKDIFGR